MQYLTLLLKGLPLGHWKPRFSTWLSRPVERNFNKLSKFCFRYIDLDFTNRPKQTQMSLIEPKMTYVFHPQEKNHSLTCSLKISNELSMRLLSL